MIIFVMLLYLIIADDPLSGWWLVWFYLAGVADG